MKRAVFFLIFLFLAIPYLLLLRYFPDWRWPEFEEFFWALRHSLAQATGSAALAILVGALLLPGYLALRGKLKTAVTWLLLSPSFFPPLFLLLSFLSWLDPFPMGNAGVILIQGFMNAGLLTVLFARLLEEKWIGLIEMAEIAGASRGLFLRASARGILPELFSLGLFVFAASFASFSIPLVIGAGKATNLEILIYEKIRISQDWGSALSLSFFQLAFMGAFALLPRTETRPDETRGADLRLWGNRAGLSLTLAYVLFFWGPLLAGIPRGIGAIRAIPGLDAEILETLLFTISVSLATGAACLGALLLATFGGPGNGLPRLIRGWIAPSTALIGFAFLFGVGDGAGGVYVLAMTLIFFPAVARLGWDRALESLRSQSEIARTLGASDFLTWRRVLLPQMWRMSCLLAGIAALWGIGEFALGKIILGRAATWSLLAESLMSSYRIEAGLGLGTLILSAGAGVFLFFWGLSHVRR